MRRQFEALSHRQATDLIVEKTCANSLRVDFVERIFPDATYLFIVRDGIDAVASAMRRWTAPFELGYTLRKLRFVPPTDIPRYASRFLVNRLARLTGAEKRLASWGPVFAGMHELVRQLPLEELCALQWKACVERARESLQRIPTQRVFRLSYEDFARDPVVVSREICDFLGVPGDSDALQAATREVRDDSIGKGRRQLDDGQLERIERRLASPV
jgi:hypothetical protein